MIDIKSLQNFFNKNLLGEITHPLKRIHGGFSHLIWKAKTNTGLYAIKQLSKNTRDTKSLYNQKEQIVKIFKKKGLSTVSCISIDNHYLFNIDGENILIYPWVYGYCLEKPDLSNIHGLKISSLIFKIHKINLNGDHTDIKSYSKIPIEKLQSSLRTFMGNHPNIKIPEKLLTDISSRYNYSINILSKNLLISHSDMHHKNIVWDQNNMPIAIDWETMQKINPTQDIIHTALFWSKIMSHNIDFEIFYNMLENYEKKGGFIDIKVIKEAINVSLGQWLHWILHNLLRLENPQTSPEENLTALSMIKESILTINHLNSNYDTILQTIVKSKKLKYGEIAI